MSIYNLILSCVIGSIEKKLLKEKFDIPDNYNIELVIALGYPKQESVIDKFKGSTTYFLDKEGTLHVPKRNLKDIMHMEKF